MHQKTILDNLNGFQFEELVANIFRKKGFRNVEVCPYTNDGGKDIIMEEILPSGEIIKTIVECKHHKNNIGRPVVQKLHSAVYTYNYTGRKKGYIVASSRFTDNAIEYTQQVNKKSNNLKIELIDGKKLKQIANSLGIDIKNGTIEAMSNKCISYSSAKDIIRIILESNIYTINNINKNYINIQNISVTF
ncbi:MAG: restriction endonuclease [Methanosarcinaceae archaeon]|nr:restriction endonuclease [Methanosarcinaceae archaeon]